MKRTIGIIYLFLTIIINAKAESSVYVFLKSMYNTDTSISINGTEVCNLNGTVKKTMSFNNTGTIIKRNGCFRKIEFVEEGKILITATMLFTVPANGHVNTYKGEIMLDGADGETYYLELTSKGIHDMQIKEVTEKKASKWIKKWENLGNTIFEL
ncbi:MAG: hypothetical protein NC080_03070 [Paraprevotella sp.]|nr:hypothetical protein [Paraprevotella sp.]